MTPPPWIGIFTIFTASLLILLSTDDPRLQPFGVIPLILGIGLLIKKVVRSHPPYIKK